MNGRLLHALIGFADEPTDDDDIRLRKRVGVIAGYINIVGPLQLPVLSQGLALGWVVAVTMPLVSALNLVVLARTRRFDRYVVVLILIVILFAAGIEMALGGLEGSSAAVLFAFLGPVYAILALGPRRATAWFVFFMVVVVGVILIDPVVSNRIAPQPYGLRLVFYAANLGVPLTITFLFLRYTDLRRRAAEARSDELLTNAIPISIAARLKRGEQRIAESYPETTVLFADLAGFTPWTRRTEPARVVSFLDDLFTRFDELAAEAGVEKIKTGRRCLHGGRRRPRAAARTRRGRNRPRARHAGRACRGSGAVRGAAGAAHRPGQRAGGGRRHRSAANPVRPVGRYRQHRLAHGVIWSSLAHPGGTVDVRAPAPHPLARGAGAGRGQGSRADDHLSAGRG